MSEPRVIKKYPNRRLYDTFESRYITLAEIRQLVIDATVFTVIDKKSGQDITRGILLQVIAEEEQRGEPAFSQEFLANVIRAYGAETRGLLAPQLEQAMRCFGVQHPRTAV